MFSPTKMRETVTTLFSAYASLSASIMLIRSMLNQLIPHNLQCYLLSLLQSWFKTQKNSSKLTLVVKYFHGFSENQVYEAATTYLTTKIGPSNHRLLVGKTENQKHISVAMLTGEEITDCFQNIALKWKLCSREKVSDSDGSRRKYYEISFDKQFRESVLSAYLPYVISTSTEIRERERAVKIYTHGGGHNDWTSIDLEHPITFEKMAMDPELKHMVMDDLKRFVGRKEFYKKVGKAWKRGYLLYGPPGTGKSSLIAAMANYLKFNVYDLELTSISDNMSLRNHLLSTANQSIIAIEDIDCSVKLRAGGAYDHETQPRPSNTKLTLSGLLNVIDGLWSSCGDERIIVFTTNHKDRLDPALLRPGRMDMHIHMSYCTIHGFKTLASNYLGIEAHQLFGEIESLLKSVEITPAEVAEQFMKSEDVDVCLTGLLELLQEKKMKNNEIKDEDGGRVETEEAKRPELDGNK